MFDYANLVTQSKKVYRATRKFKFREAAKLLDDMYDEIEQADAITTRLGDLEEYSNVPLPVLWMNNSRKPPKVLEKLKALAAELSCACKPTACKCIPTTDANSNPRLRCRLCEDVLTGNDIAWVDSKNYTICGCCNDILFDILYPEIRAKDKIDEVVEAVLWWSYGDRPQLPKALQLLSDARNWCQIAADFPNAEN